MLTALCQIMLKVTEILSSIMACMNRAAYERKMDELESSFRTAHAMGHHSLAAYYQAEILKLQQQQPVEPLSPTSVRIACSIIGLLLTYWCGKEVWNKLTDWKGVGEIFWPGVGLLAGVVLTLNTLRMSCLIVVCLLIVFIGLNNMHLFYPSSPQTAPEKDTNSKKKEAHKSKDVRKKTSTDRQNGK